MISLLSYSFDAHLVSGFEVLMGNVVMEMPELRHLVLALYFALGFMILRFLLDQYVFKVRNKRCKSRVFICSFVFPYSINPKPYVFF